MTDPKETSKSNRKRIQFILVLLSIIVVAGIISRFFFQFMLIEGKSMEPAYHHMQIVMLDKIHQQYHSGDVIAFYCKELDSILVKRIVAEPGETAYIHNGTLYHNNHVSEVFPTEVVFEYAGILEKPILLENEEYIVIGDNITQSKDSRYAEVGIIEKNDIIGKVI